MLADAVLIAGGSRYLLDLQRKAARSVRQPEVVSDSVPTISAAHPAAEGSTSAPSLSGHDEEDATRVEGRLLPLPRHSSSFYI
jgi:hypothetical protein